MEIKPGYLENIPLEEANNYFKFIRGTETILGFKGHYGVKFHMILF
jgi:hypothetical protein